MNTKFLASVFEKHNISSVYYLEDKNYPVFLIKEMDSSIPLERWTHLENVLKDATNSEVSILSYDYAKNHIDVSKAMVIK